MPTEKPLSEMEAERFHAHMAALDGASATVQEPEQDDVPMDELIDAYVDAISTGNLEEALRLENTAAEHGVVLSAHDGLVTAEPITETEGEDE